MCVSATFLTNPLLAALMYMCIGGVIFAATLSLVLALYFTKDVVFWYFIFGCVVGFILFTFGLVNLVKYCRGQHHVDQLEVQAEMHRYAGRNNMWEREHFEQSQVAIGAPAAQPHQMNPPLYKPPGNMPAPTAPPPQSFVQDAQWPGEEVPEDRKSEFDFSPVEYKRPT